MSPAAFAPQEILERILPSRSHWHTRCPFKVVAASLLPHEKCLKGHRPGPLVNRHWNEAATRILYWELVVNELGQEETPAALSKNALLTRTLEQSPRLQAHVRSLRLITWTTDNDREKLKWLNLRILRCCTLLQHLWIHGWIPSLLNQFHTTIATFTRLRYLSIQAFTDYRDPFCSFEGLEAMMRGWPNLERLEFGAALSPTTGDSVRSTQTR
jgi:hypothetical protein